MSIILWKPHEDDLKDLLVIKQNGDGVWHVRFLAVILGLGLSVIGTHVLFKCGIPITRWHILLVFTPIWAVPIIWYKKDLRSAFKDAILNTVIIIVTIFFCAQFFDLGGDGMATHQESIIGLSSDWNPHEDLYFLKSKERWSQYPELEHAFWVGKGIVRSTSYILSAIINKGFGAQEAGKSLHLISLWMGFCSAMAFSEIVFKRKRNQWLFSLFAVANPVILYQCLSYWQDGIVAGFYTSLIFASLSWILEPKKWSHYIAILLLCFILSGFKVSGVGFSGLTCFWIYFCHLIFRKIKFHWTVLSGVTLLFLILCSGSLSGIWAFKHNIFGPLAENISNHQSDKFYSENSFSQVMANQDRSRWCIFFLSSFSQSKSAPSDIELKIPFTVTPEDLKTFYHFFEDPRAGGYGPLYSGLVLLSFLLFALFCRENIWRSIFAVAGIIILISPLFFIPTFWARWIPQMWLLPVFLSFPAWLKYDEQKDRKNHSPFRLSKKPPLVTWLSYFSVLNAVFVFVPYLSGNTFASWMIHQQLNIVSQLDKPLKYGHGYFATNRKWLIDRGIEYDLTWDTEDWNKPSLQFYRTNTRIFLAPDDLSFILKNGQSVFECINSLCSIKNKWQPEQWLNEIWVDSPNELSNHE